MRSKSAVRFCSSLPSSANILCPPCFRVYKLAWMWHPSQSCKQVLSLSPWRSHDDKTTVIGRKRNCCQQLNSAFLENTYMACYNQERGYSQTNCHLALKPFCTAPVEWALRREIILCDNKHLHADSQFKVCSIVTSYLMTLCFHDDDVPLYVTTWTNNRTRPLGCCTAWNVSHFVCHWI